MLKNFDETISTKKGNSLEGSFVEAEVLSLHVLCMKKVLILSYYWPPSGGSGVQRWLKMSKYLPEYGWLPIIYTADGGEAPALDASLAKDVHPDVEVIRTKVREPYALYKRFVGQKKEEGFGAGFLNEGKKVGIAQKISIWVRGNFFIPDARMLWIRPSVKYLRKYLNEHQVDAIVSTGPPHSMHMIALGLKQAFPNIPWVADFRDPWTTIDFYDQLMLTPWADRKHRRLEKKVLQTADRVVTVSEGCRRDLMESGADDVEVVMNGFDSSDFEKLKTWDGKQFTIIHVGSMNADRNPTELWAALGEKASNEDLFKDKLRIRLIGKVDHQVMESLTRNALSEHVERVPYMSHDAIIDELSSSAVLLLVINDTPNAKGILTGKLFEYLAVRRPILCVGNRCGEAAMLIASFKAGNTVEHGDKVGARKEIDQLFEGYLDERLNLTNFDLSSIERRNQAIQISTTLSGLVSS